jgi:hypothetical protein
VREIRQHGSEGGGAEANRPFLPLSRSRWFFRQSGGESQSCGADQTWPHGRELRFPPIRADGDPGTIVTAVLARGVKRLAR